MLEETRADLTEVRLLFVELLLQALEELLLKPVNLFNVAKYGPQLVL